ncbi:MAG: 1,4-dihydroxy-2-naphthoate polyprenyltransferase [Cyclobacteriaceae bacterium]|nr:1,4-dihydroxy-2-naphthoate polyprenyltransferase [Cyclobacteriaceae bacterium SS2]
MSKINIWLQAFRLRTLPLALSSILMGSLLAVSHGYFDTAIFLLGVLTTIFLQILSNLANDYGDAKSGIDGMDRKGPSRTVQAGLIEKQEMKRMLYVFVVLSLISGISLIVLALGDQWMKGLMFFILGLGAIAAAINYTVGKSPYGYSGWGDLFVLMFFGFVGVLGSYFLLSGQLTPWLILPAISTGLFSVAVLNLNNIRDIESDRKNGKFSIPVRLGRTRAVIYHYLLLVLGMVSAITYVIFEGTAWYSWAFLLVVPLLIVNARAVSVKKEASDLDPYLKQMAISTLFFVLLFGFGQVQF